LTLVAGGIALFIPGDFASSFLTFTALVNFHHFILAGAIWKLRDSRIASFLLNKRETGEEVAVPTRGRVAATFHWLTGASPAARTLRVVAIALLLLWGAFDQLHFYWVNVSANFVALKRAALLNPEDSSVQSRLARAAETAGDREAALSALRRAAEVNPANLSLQEAYARGLITAGRDADAYALYRRLLSRAPDNVDALVNNGLLAHRLGHEAEAMDSWQRAVEVDPAQGNAELYLAQFLEQQGEHQAAARHYRAYLQLVGKHPDRHRSEGPLVISALINVADADAESKKPAEARRGYQAAAQFAQKLGDNSLQSLALAHSAAVEESTAAIYDAASHYQQVLRVDETAGDPRSAASDWFNYGQFLRRQHQPERLVYACFLQAQDLLRTTPGEELSAIIKARQESEAQLGAEASSARAHHHQLLSLPASAFSSSAR